MLTKIYKISKIINTLVSVLGFILIIIAGVHWWRKNKNRKGFSAVEYFSNADVTVLTDKEFKKFNEEKDMMILFKKYNCYQHIFYLSKPLIKYMR